MATPTPPPLSLEHTRNQSRFQKNKHKKNFLFLRQKLGQNSPQYGVHFFSDRPAGARGPLKISHSFWHGPSNSDFCHKKGAGREKGRSRVRSSNGGIPCANRDTACGLGWAVEWTVVPPKRTEWRLFPLHSNRLQCIPNQEFVKLVRLVVTATILLVT